MLTLESESLELINKALEELKGRKLKSMQLYWKQVEAFIMPVLQVEFYEEGDPAGRGSSLENCRR